jgi:hypothetical protein
MLKLEFQRSGSYRIRAYSEKWFFRYKNRRKPFYLTTYGDYNHPNEYWETFSYDKAIQQLYSERRKTILNMVAYIRIKQDEKVRAKAVAYQNKRLKNI